MPPLPLPEIFDDSWIARIANLEVAALDLDDTLLTSDKTVAAETLAALEAWLQAGKKVVLATGRPPRMAREVPDLPHQFPAVCYNGCWIEDAGEVVYRNEIPAATVQHFVNLVLACAPDLWIGVESNDMMYEPYKLRAWRESVVCDVREICLPAMKIIFRKSLLDTEQLDYVRHCLPASCDMLVSDLYDLIQVMRAGADKVQGVSWWLQSQGLTLRHTVAVGDDTNDTQMVAGAQMGVAMQNAVKEVQSVADFVTSTNDEGGVARVLHAILAVTQSEYIGA